MRDSLKVLLGVLGGAVLVLLLISAFAGDGVGSMMGGGMIGGGMVGMLFMLLFWGLILALIVAAVVWIVGEISRR